MSFFLSMNGRYTSERVTHPHTYLLFCCCVIHSSVSFIKDNERGAYCFLIYRLCGAFCSSSLFLSLSFSRFSFVCLFTFFVLLLFSSPSISFFFVQLFHFFLSYLSIVSLCLSRSYRTCAKAGPSGDGQAGSVPTPPANRSPPQPIKIPLLWR